MSKVTRGKIKAICLSKLAELGLDFIPLESVEREDLRGGWFYCRGLGFSFVLHAIHDDVAFWVSVYLSPKKYLDKFINQHPSKLKHYLEEAKDDKHHITVQDDLLRRHPVAVKTSDIFGLNPFCGDRSLFNSFELEKLEQFMPLMTLDELF